MSYLTIFQFEQLRQTINWDKWPLSPEEWPTELLESSNCLGFALGIPFADKGKYTFTPVFLKSFIPQLLSGLGLDYRNITSDEEANPDEIIIKCYENLPFNNGFHLIRRNLDGRWVHKEGWYEPPTEIVFNGYFNCMYPPEAITSIFAVKKRTS